MEPIEVLGAVAHPGGMLVRRPELTVGVVRAVSRPSGLTLELLARSPRESNARTPRAELSDTLRAGWLKPDGGVRWEYATSGEYYTSHTGTVVDRLVYVLPPLFGEVSLVLAWPEIGFPETVVPLSTPSRDEVEATAVSVWESPRVGVPVEEEFERHRLDPETVDVALEHGVAVAAPRVVHGSDDAVVVLTRVVDHGSLLSLELLSIARGVVAFDASAHAHEPSGPDYIPSSGGAVVAVVRGRAAYELRLGSGGSGGGLGSFTATAEYTVDRPVGGVLDLLVSWLPAGLAEARVRVDLAG
ncbi:MAG: hypothetical protein ABIQ18_05985 [Umezawaea sp.]